MDCHKLLTQKGLSVEAVELHSSWWGLLVVTKLDTEFILMSNLMTIFRGLASPIPNAGATVHGRLIPIELSFSLQQPLNQFVKTAHIVVRQARELHAHSLP